MNFTVDSLTYGPMQLRPIVPASFAKLVIPGSRPHCAEGAFGKILFQEMHTSGITLFYNIYQTSEDLALRFHIKAPVCCTHIILKNQNRYEIDGVGVTTLQQGQFNILHSSAINGTHYLEKNNEYRTLGIYYPVSQLQEFLPLFPFLDDFIHKSVSGKPALLFSNHQRINAKITDAIDDLLYCPYHGSMRRLYFNYKIRELLLFTLSCKHPKSSQEVNSHAFDPVSDAKHSMEADVHKSLRLPRIAKQGRMDDIKLSGGFKSLFGIGIVEHLLKRRMEKLERS